MNDSDVIKLVLQGDINAFEMLIIKYQSKIFYVALNIVKDQEFAEDITQEAFLKAFEKLSTLQDGALFYSWLKRIAINLSLNHYERNKRIVDMEDNDDDNNSTSFFERVADYDNPEEKILNDELYRYIKIFVDSLPEKLRLVMILREIDELSYEEIAELLKIPIGTVRSRLFNARQIVKERLIRQGLSMGKTSEFHSK